MKKLLMLMIAALGLTFQSCEGPVGPPGPPGPQGEDGYNIVGEVHEVANVNFTAANNYYVGFNFTKPILSSDKLLGYVLVNEGQEDVWEPLPQVFFYNGATYLYTFEFSKSGFAVFLDGNGNFANLPADKRTNKVFRFVVIPADMAKTVNTNNYLDVVSKLNLKETAVIKY